MIPHKLQLKNFLSYGPQLQTVDFSGHSLICLSGKNGHGKSALLDAMTWAIWGQARKVTGAAKADQGLLRLGQTHMLVIFDFEVNGTAYRIRREYMETFNKPVAVLEFGSINPETQEFIPLTDKTIRTTQAKIEQTLRLDFDAFANSAFLRQGNSNEFSKKTPKDRKYVLASILGLDQYEAIRKQALEKIKDATAKKNGLTLLQEKRMADLATHEQLQQELHTFHDAMKNITSEEQVLQKKYTLYQTRKKELEKEQQHYSLLNLQLQQIQNAYSISMSRMRDIRSTWRTVNAKKHSLPLVQQLEQQKKDILAHIATHQKLFQSNLEYKAELLRITQELHAIEQQHKNEIARLQHKALLDLERLSAEQSNKQKIITLLEDEYKKNELEYTAIGEKRTTLEKTIVAQTINQETLKQAEASLEKRKNSYQSFVTLGNIINTELKSIIQKKNLIHADDPSCPLCEQNLSAARKRLLSTNFNKQESFLKHRLERLRRIIPSLKDSLLLQHEQLQKNKEVYQTTQQAIAQIKDLVRTQDKIALNNIEITAKIVALQQEITLVTETIQTQHNVVKKISLDTPIENNSQHIQLHAHKKTIEQQLNDTPCDSRHYEQKQKELALLEKQLTEYEHVQADVAHQESRAAEISTLCTTLKQLKRDIARITAEYDHFKEIEIKLSALVEQEKQHHDALMIIQTKKDSLLQTQGRIEAEQKRLAKTKKEFEEEEKNIAQLNAIIDDYHIICNATGKDGIQALLIEDAIPEIEQEANQLLAQLTNNQAHIFIESLRDLKKGGTKETLDIKISDQNGIRPYELFSGGEAFRIDFALRIAISKLLARRAGTALQTLIIDEGFGSQDDEGLSHIMDALHAIQNNFSKIIVVSHLPAMKDQFPVQFVVQKGVQGSTITVVEQG